MRVGVSFTRAGKVSYVLGGGDEASRERMNALGNIFNLKLVFGKGLCDVVGSIRVTISDAAERSLVQATTDEPIFLAQIQPAGTYMITAVQADKRTEREITVVKDNQRTIDFRWPSEP